MLRKKSCLMLKAAGAAATALLFGILVAGCGSDDAPNSTPVTPPEDSTDTPPVTPPDDTLPTTTTPETALRGTWVGTMQIDTFNISISLSIDGNSYLLSLNDVDRERGTFSIDGVNSVTFTPIQVPGELFYLLPGIDPLSWYTKSELRAVIDEIYIGSGAGPISDEQFETLFGDFFERYTQTFVLTDDNLTLTDDDGVTSTLARQN